MNPLATLTGKIITAALVIILLLGFLQVRSCQQSRQRAAESRLQRAQTDALTNSAQDAIATQGAAQGRERASEDLTHKNAEEIRNAAGSTDAVNPAVRDAGLRSLCRRAAYSGSERCRLFNARAAGVVDGR